MSRSTIVAAGLFAVAVVAMAVALALWAVGVEDPFTPDIVLFPLAYLALACVGALILARRQENRIGRLALIAGVGGSIVGLADTYARIATPVVGREWVAVVAAVGFPSTLAPILFLILLFPTGRLASPLWRIVALMIGFGAVLIAIGHALTPRFADFEHLDNPLGMAALEGSPLEHGGVGWLLLVAGAVLAAAGLVPRLRRATGVERQQLKWITFAAAVHGASWLILTLDLPGVLGEAAQWLLFATLALIPLAAGIAILRYRLYEIDLVIRRTLVYGAVVGLLAVTYVALVLLLQAALSGVVGGTFPVALSTVAIAALFGPVRSRVRDAVDRRFYRARYDARQTLETFAARLRDEVELRAVVDVLLATTGTAVRPSSVGVWIRPRRP